jgi:hypothetical protein
MAQGLVFPGAPSGVEELAVNHEYWVMEAPEAGSAGNGDGLLGPGESFQVAIDLNNWSLETHKGVQVSMDWDPSLAHLTWESDFSVGNASVRPDAFALLPGGQRHLELPSLTLSPDARTGQRVELDVRIVSNKERWSKSLAFVVEGSYPAYEAAFRVPGHEILEQSVLLATEEATSIQALVRGEVEGVDLVALSSSQIGASAFAAMIA